MGTIKQGDMGGFQCFNKQRQNNQENHKQNLQNRRRKGSGALIKDQLHQ